MPTCAHTLPLCLLALACARPGAAEDANPVAVRAQIDRLIAARVAAHKPVDVGLMRDAVVLTIGVGGKQFDAGDAKGCATYYLETAKRLGAAFPTDKDATAAALPLMRDFADAVTRTKALSDPSRQCWTLRFAFDQVAISTNTLQAAAQAQVQLGAQYFSRGDDEEAEIALERAEKGVDELLGADGGGDLGGVQVNPRVAGIIHAQVLLARGQSREAAQLMARGLLLVPELPNSNFDWKKVANDPDPDKHQAAAAEAAKAHADDVELGLLLAMEQKFNGHADDAAKTLAALDKAHPGNAAVAMLLGKQAGAAAPTAPAPAPPTGAGGEFVP